MKALLLAALTLSTPAFAGTYDFICKTTESIDSKYRHTRISFTARITANKAEYITEDPDSYTPVEMVPEHSVLDLNQNFEIHRTKKGIALTADGDGETATTVELYENSGYRAGYAKVEMSDDSHVFSTVSCTVEEKR